MIQLCALQSVVHDLIAADPHGHGRSAAHPPGRYAYRTGVIGSEAVKPLVLFLLDPDGAAVPGDQLTKALNVIESWLVRRTLVRASRSRRAVSNRGGHSKCVWFGTGAVAARQG
ncbi:MAG TPA: hypothetical protein VE733_24450 [Streptosporangiaceae bacterium]|jgi:hypothetical protein|nr:hypothetical protein [Streptosporangiaceae bacterium]